MRFLRQIFFFLILIPFINNSFAQTIPTLVWPKNGVFIYSTEISFQWNYVPEVVNYTLELSAMQDFSELLTEKTISENSYDTIINDLNPGHYFWRIRGNFSENLSTDYSDIYKFTYFDPTIIQDIKLWLSGSEGVELINDSINQWNDLSGNNFFAFQNNPQFKPKLAYNVLNNKPVVRFNVDFLQLDFNEVFSQPNSIFFVWNTNSSGAQHLYDYGSPRTYVIYELGLMKMN